MLDASHHSHSQDRLDVFRQRRQITGSQCYTDTGAPCGKAGKAENLATQAHLRCTPVVLPGGRMLCILRDALHKRLVLGIAALPVVLRGLPAFVIRRLSPTASCRKGAHGRAGPPGITVPKVFSGDSPVLTSRLDLKGAHDQGLPLRDHLRERTRPCPSHR